MATTVISKEHQDKTLAPTPPNQTLSSENGASVGLRQELQQAAPRIHDLLKDSATLEAAREALYTYLNNREQGLYSLNGHLHPLDHAIAREGIRVLKSILAPRNEAQAGFSTLEHLWRFIRNDASISQGVSESFVLEFVHLFRGLRGQSAIAQGWLGPILAEEGVQAVDFREIEGRAAGVARSDYLDQAANQIWTLVNRHPSGLDPDLIAQREDNKQKILDFFDATPLHWDNHAWQLGHIFRGVEALPQLEALIPMTRAEREAIHLCVEYGIPFGITPYYLSLFDFESADRRKDVQVRAQVIPPMHYVERLIEHRDDREYYFDFMGEHDTSPIDLVTRRYATIAILKGYDTCPQICVYCQRNWEITGPMEAGALPSRNRLDAALDWFGDHPNLRDVLITGGDPLFLGDGRIEYMMDRLSTMDHIIHIRWGTRAPVTMPMRITERLAELLGRYVEPGRRNVGVVTHIESATEVTPEMAEAIYRLRRRGIYVYNQQVFTLHTSRRFQAVANRIAMKKIGVDPYYTFYPKGKEETRDYTTPLARVLQERKEEARLLPGAFRTDEPVFNVPRLGKNHIRAWQDRELIAIRPEGRRVYLWHPWEKGITPMKPWLYLDNSIYTYLQELEQLGEDPEDYASIWYYY
ncbi:MAG: KamA family radical SAM protein [Anaerolineae bacterium]|jgi:lysine 2,3-aminomutase